MAKAVIIMLRGVCGELSQQTHLDVPTEAGGMPWGVPSHGCVQSVFTEFGPEERFEAIWWFWVAGTGRSNSGAVVVLEELTQLLEGGYV